MAGNRKSQSASIRFDPALKALFLCLLIAGAAVGYVWQKGQIIQLGKQIGSAENRLNQLRSDNERLANQLSVLRSPVMLDERARQLNLGLVPAQPSQIFRLPEWMLPENKNQSHQFVSRSMMN
ncbi:MAG TPA: septum formation initiator family protein [Methylomirabilota bacterium]|nr:septum formation initiator family protein [Methylomirabilota bacterium]